MENLTFRIVPLPTEVAEAARARAREGAPDHEILTTEQTGTYPCRHCLRWAEPGERVVLFSYASIPQGRPYSETGPIFVHEHPCARYNQPDAYPAEFRRHRVLRAYNESNHMIDAVVLNGSEPETVIEALFQNPATAFLQARSATRGCYTFAIARA
ncbi:MAG: DUF1203 domain-containing protein [Spartobacteria bacterium]